jgi:hypothetical protein
MGYRVSFALRIVGAFALVGLLVWGASAANVSAPNGLKTALAAFNTDGKSTAKKSATVTPTPTATASTSTESVSTKTSTASASTSASTSASSTTLPFMATLTNKCVPDPSLPSTYYAGTNCADPGLHYQKYLITLSSEIYHVVGYQPKLVQLGQETCGELASYDQTRVVMDITQWLVAEQNPANPRAAAYSVLNAATKNLCPALRTKVTI